MIAITGANGNLGKLIVKGLLKKLPASQIVAAVEIHRSPLICATSESRYGTLIMIDPKRYLMRSQELRSCY